MGDALLILFTSRQILFINADAVLENHPDNGELNVQSCLLLSIISIIENIQALLALLRIIAR